MENPDQMTRGNKPLVGISTCLLGENVRYDGGHKLDRYLRDTLGRYVDFSPVCPEVECGMGIPREAVRLVEEDGEVKLVTRETGIDMTGQMRSWMAGRLDGLAKLPLCGFIFKSRSPSSGLMRIKVYTDRGVRNDGVGVFARGFVERFPHLPVEDDGRLNDSKLRENFIERVFVMHRWHGLLARDRSLSALLEFHADHKYLLMAHDPAALKALGAALARGRGNERIHEDYLQALAPALAKIATPRKNTNVLQHIMGYFKKELSPDEKAELLEIIDKYHQGILPLVVPVTMLGHYVRRLRPEYLLRQVYLNPHPGELMLRNHV